MYRFDLHIHSCYSHDSFSKPRRVLRQAKKIGLHGIAITDHDTIRGAVKAQQINKDPNFIVIIGAEYKTDIGDIIGLFLKEEIKSRHWETVINEIHQQGGISMLPHPFDGHDHSKIHEIIKKIDVVESFNSRCSKKNNDLAIEIANRAQKAMVAGSDAHFIGDIGKGETVFSTKDVRAELFKNNASFKTHYSYVYRYHYSQLIKKIKTKTFNFFWADFFYLIKSYIKEIILKKEIRRS